MQNGDRIEVYNTITDGGYLAIKPNTTCIRVGGSDDLPELYFGDSIDTYLFFSESKRNLEHECKLIGVFVIK